MKYCCLFQKRLSTVQYEVSLFVSEAPVDSTIWSIVVCFRSACRQYNMKYRCLFQKRLLTVQYEVSLFVSEAPVDSTI